MLAPGLWHSAIGHSQQAVGHSSPGILLGTTAGIAGGQRARLTVFYPPDALRQAGQPLQATLTIRMLDGMVLAQRQMALNPDTGAILDYPALDDTAHPGSTIYGRLELVATVTTDEFPPDAVPPLPGCRW